MFPPYIFPVAVFADRFSKARIKSEISYIEMCVGKREEKRREGFKLPKATDRATAQMYPKIYTVDCFNVSI